MHMLYPHMIYIFLMLFSFGMGRKLMLLKVETFNDQLE